MHRQIDTLIHLSNCDDNVNDDDDDVHYCYLRVGGSVGVEDKSLFNFNGRIQYGSEYDNNAIIKCKIFIHNNSNTS